ncbi:L10-interacting MYB domain-containing protein-like [Camellia sinensis]|uniref:L10-interacting MYB domain-containing protein-like n=1 Tax=Camellia sinensis TaxID=4442 RepID=UPI0010362620|nr:L10-interacting MYB domain-containing protein-like [Camellia sinensis]
MSSQPPSQSPTTTKSKGKVSQNSQPSQGLKAHWDTKSIKIFVKLCVEQVKAGHRPGTHLDRVGWEAVINKFKIVTGKSYWNLKLQRYPDAARFCDKPLILADDIDIVFFDVSATGEWAYIPSSGRYPDAARFCDKPLILADDIDIVFSDVSATGEWAYIPSSGVFLDTEGSHTPLGDDTDTEIHHSELCNQFCR